MPATKTTLIIPVLLITLGIGWLLAVLEVTPNIDWAWTLGLAVIGILTFFVMGFDKFTLVAGSFFLITSLLSILRQTGRLTLDVEVPVLVITIGILLLVARSKSIPAPSWIVDGTGQLPAKKDD